MPNPRDSKKAAIKAFAPSFSGSTIQPFQSLFEYAYQKATDTSEAGNIFEVIDKGADKDEHFEVENNVAGVDGWFEFGHLPPKTGDLSEICPFRMTAEFNGDNLNLISIDLFVLNPRFLFSDHGYTAAVIGKDFHYDVSAGSEKVGLIIRHSKDSAGSTDKGAIFKELKDGLPQVAFAKPGGTWQPLTEDTLVGRIDVEMSWRAKNGKFVLNGDAKARGKTAASFPGKADRTKFRLFSFGLDASFNGLLHESERFGISIESAISQSANAVIVLGDHSSISGKEKTSLQSALRDFGLQSDFRGVLFTDIGAHWLDDGAMGANITSKESVKGAISFNENAGGMLAARLFAAVSCTIDPTNNNSYLKLLEPGSKFKLSVAGSKVRFCSLAVQFAKLERDENPYYWLSERKAAIALRSFAVKGSSDEYGIDITFDADESGPLALLTADDLHLPAEAFTLVATVLTLAPIFKLASLGRITAPKNKDDKRVSFVEISAADAVGGALFGAGALAAAWFFKKALHASELRVTGARILSQPGSTKKRETAILFDVETELSVEADDLPISSSQAIAIRVENTGLLYSNNSFRWVQALQGAFQISVADGSSWNFDALGGLLRVKDISFKLDEAPILGLTLGMSINLGVVTVDDFKVEVDIASPDRSFGIYPSKMTVDLSGVLEGEGEISFGSGKDFSKDISGKLDLTLASGLRMAAAARVAQFQPDETGTVTAFAAGAEVVFATAIPLLSTGLGIKGFGALYAAHFQRTEKKTIGIPPSLEWLQRAHGEVAIGSIFDKKLWAPKYDSWSFGLGVLLELEACDVLLNLNAMLVVEIPGPRIIIFAKLNILDPPKPNKDQTDLIAGMLAVLELDVPNQKLILGASIDYKLDFARIYGTLDNQYSFRDLSDWHLYLGHFSRQVSAVLKLGDILNAGATGYVMAAGNMLAGVPRGGRGTVDLPGLALALGAHAYATIGSGLVYLRADMQAFLDVSLSKDIYAAGGLALSGELFIFVAGIGISAELSFEFYSGAGGTFLTISGRACGSIKIGFQKWKGCVSVNIGNTLPQKISIPPLIFGASLVSGTNVALLGQGATTRAIDGVLFTMEKDGKFEDFRDAPLDVVIGISMAAAPAFGANSGFLKNLSPAATTTIYNYGKKSGGYNLSAAALRKLNKQGDLEDIEYDKAPAVWWRSTQRPGNGQPLATDLALLTRRPFAVQNAIPSEETMKRWIDALTNVTSLCDTVPPQVAVYAPQVLTEGTIDEKTKGLSWQLRGRFKDRMTGIAAGGMQPGPLKAIVLQRTGYGKLDDPFAGYPQHLARKVVEKYTAAGEVQSFSFLSLLGLPYLLEGIPTILSLDCAGFAVAANEQPPSRFIELLVASAMVLDKNDLNLSCVADNGPQALNVSVEQIGSDGKIFHEDYENWKDDSGGFLSLSGRPGYGVLNYARVVVELISAFDPDHPPIAIRLSWRDRASHAGRPLLIGAVKYLSIEEALRFKKQKAYNDVILRELEEFLKPPLVPILDPDSKYEVELSWVTVGTDVTSAAEKVHFRFSTTEKPPSLLAPYLLATFPAAGEQLHPYGHQPGFSISSGDILRILKKFPGLRLKISILEDGNNPVEGRDAQGNKIDWVSGELYNPGLLLDPLELARGLDRKWFNALPSPLLRAIKSAMSAMSAGTLQCLDNSIELDQGQWIGIMVDLKPLLGYSIRLQLVGADGVVQDPPFLEWHFRTGVQSNLHEQGELFARPIEKRRKLLSLPNRPAEDFALELKALSQTVGVCDEFMDTNLDGTSAPAASLGTVSLIPDQALEDALTRWTGERPTLKDETEKTILWTESGNTLVATGLLLRAREPMLRRTLTPKITRVDTDSGSADVLKLDWIVTRFPSMTKSKGIEALYVSSSGTAAIAIFDSARGSHDQIVIRGEEYAPHYLPYSGAGGVTDLVAVEALK